MTTVDRKAFAAALKRVAPAVPSRATLPVLFGVRLSEDGAGVLMMQATNLDLSIHTSVDLQSVATGADVVVPHRTLARIVGKLVGDTVDLEPGDDGVTLQLRAGRATASVSLLPLDEFPRTTDVMGEKVTLTADHQALIRRVMYAASSDTNRPILTGIHFVGNQVQATDSFRLAVAECDDWSFPDDDRHGVIVPVAAVRAALGKDELAVLLSDRSAVFMRDGTSWVSRVIEGQFPPCKQFLEPGPVQVTVDRSALADTLARAAAVTDSNYSRVALNTQDETLSVTASTTDVGSLCDQLPCNGTVPEGIGFNIRFLAELVAHCVDDKVTFAATDHLKPVVVTDDSCTHVLMPHR